MEHYRLVHENDKYAIVGGMGINGQAIPRYSPAAPGLRMDEPDAGDPTAARTGPQQ